MDKNDFLERIRKLTSPLAPVAVNTKPRLHQLKNIRCIAFDFYGTMFISAVGDIGIDEEKEESNAGYFAEALESSGFTLLKENAAEKGIQIFSETIDSHIENAKNNGIDYPEPVITAVWLDVLTILLDLKLINGKISEEAAMLFGIEFEFRVNDVWPIPNLKPVLTKLLERDLKLGIISNSQFYTPLTFEAILGKSPADFGFDPDLLIWSYESGRKKPSPAFYRLFDQAAKKKNINPEEILFVGNDIRKDIQPAKEVGMKTALYIGDQRSVRHEDHELELSEFMADIVINDLKQLLECL